jgi:signal transduction histidine kinase
LDEKRSESVSCPSVSRQTNLQIIGGKCGRSLMGEHLGELEVRIAPQMGSLIRQLGHDVRNKLSVMKNSVFFIRMKVGNSDPKVDKHLDIIEREISAANRAVMSLWDCIWPKPPVCQDIQLHKLTLEALTQAQIPDGVSARVEISPEATTVWADRVQLKSALVNILIWLAEDPTSTDSLTIFGLVRDGCAEILMACMGCEAGPSIFEAILEGDAATPDMKTYVPLVVSKKLLLGHGGDLTLEAVPLGGIIVRARLPVKAYSAAESPLPK